jgi:hypothetical protein
MAASDVDRRLVVVEAGLQWSWAASGQVRRLRRHEQEMGDLLGADGAAPAAGWQARFFAMRSDAEFCLLATSNLVQAIDELVPEGRAWPRHASSEELVEAIVTLRQAFVAPRARRRHRGDRSAGVIDLRDDPLRCSFDVDGTRIRGLGLDDLEAALEPVAACFAMLERTAFAWEGWRAVHA